MKEAETYQNQIITTEYSFEIRPKLDIETRSLEDCRAREDRWYSADQKAFAEQRVFGLGLEACVSIFQVLKGENKTPDTIWQGTQV